MPFIGTRRANISLIITFYVLCYFTGSAVWAALQTRLRQPEGFGGYREIQQWLAEEWGVELAYHSVHRLVHRRLGAAPKRPRPVHPKKTSRRPPAFPPDFSVPSPR